MFDVYFVGFFLSTAHFEAIVKTWGGMYFGAGGLEDTALSGEYRLLRLREAFVGGFTE